MKLNTASKINKNGLLFPIVTFIVLFLICGYALASVTGSYEEDYAVGSISNSTITAPEDFVDEYSTSVKREEAKQKVPPCYSIDKAISAEAISKFNTDFSAIENIRSATEDAFRTYYTEIGLPVTSYKPRTIRWESVLNVTQIQSFLTEAPDYFTQETVFKCAKFTEENLESARIVIDTKINEYYADGILESELESTLEDIKNSIINESDCNSDELNFVMEVVTADLRANKEYDQAATEAMKEATAMEVPEVVYKKNQNIIQKGEIITQAQFEILKQIGFTDDSNSALPKKLSAYITMAVLFFIAFMYLYVNDRNLLTDAKQFASLVLIICIGVFPTLLTRKFDNRICLVYLPVIIGAITLKRRVSFAFSVFMSVLLGILQSTASEYIFSPIVYRFIFSALAGSSILMVSLKNKHHRRQYIWAGSLAGITSAVVNLGYCLVLSNSGASIAENASIALGCGIVCGFIGVGILPVFEAIFSISTPARLLELCDPGSELLRRITYDIPGTYHHSVLMGNLAEAACDAIGADSLLVRVASYYHDLGKLLHPTMFKENQLHIANVHDNLSPQESAKIIISHVSDGAMIAKEYKLPQNIIDIITQHHGTSLVAYFYNKAKETETAPAEIDYRYQGPKPQTKEAAVLMLADTVEAAIRANELKDIEEIRNKIDVLIQGKINDGQLDESPVSFNDIVMIKRAFLNVYEGANHTRVRYPGDKKENK